MIAAEYDRYGAASELVVREVAELGELASGSLRVRVFATSVNPKDTFVRKGRFKALVDATFPKRVGYDFAGVVEDVAADVADVTPGRRVFGMVNGWAGRTCASHVHVRSTEIAPLPDSVSFEDAAAVPLAALTAYQALVDLANVAPGRHVVVNGASGGVGLFAVQIAKALGARVTAIASESRAALCTSAGADDFVDYASDSEFGSLRDFDVVFDVFGNLHYDRIAPRMREGGIFISTVPSPQTFAAIAATQDATRKRARLVVVDSRAADLSKLARMLERKTLRPHVDRVYPIARIREAHEYVERKHTAGKVIVTPQ